MTLPQSQPGGHLNDVELRGIIESQAALIQRLDAEIERLRKLEETPAPPVVHAVVLLDDHEKIEAEVKRLRGRFAEVARVLARGIPDDRKLATITRLVHADGMTGEWNQ